MKYRLRLSSHVISEYDNAESIKRELLLMNDEDFESSEVEIVEITTSGAPEYPTEQEIKLERLTGEEFLKNR